MKRLLLSLLMIPCLCHAQLSPLNIGDKVPALEITSLVNTQVKRMNLGDFRDRLLIIDFWGTKCGACLVGMANLDTIREAMHSSFDVLSVNNGSKKAEVQAFLVARKNLGKPLLMPSVVEDPRLDQLFPHLGIPHYIWIYKGTIKAITGPKEITFEHIENMLKGNIGSIVMKKTQDRHRLLFTNEDLPDDRIVSYSFLLKGDFPGLGSGYGEGQGPLKGRRIAITNLPLGTMFEFLAMRLVPEYFNKKMILNVRDSGLLIRPTDARLTDEWEKANHYSVDVLVGPDSAGKQYKALLRLLNEQTVFSGAVIKRDTTTWVISKKSQSLLLKVSTNRFSINVDDSCIYMKGVTLKGVISYLNNEMDGFNIPLVNETGENIMIDLDIPRHCTSPESLMPLFEKIGFTLSKQKRTISYFEVTQKK